MNIAILGLGNFGTAIAACWLRAGHDVAGWTVEDEVFESIASSGVNRKYLDHVSLDGLACSMDIESAIDEAEVVVLALPSHVICNFLGDLEPHLRPAQVALNVSKGLGTHDRLMSDVIAENLTNPAAIMVGPTIAPELADGVFSTAIVAARDASVADRLAVNLTTDTFRLSVGVDPRGAELWSVFKNVIALTCGLSDGLGAGGDNLKAALFLAGCREATRLLPQLGADPDTFLTPAGLGDVFVTATSAHGRNRSLGEQLGSGASLASAEASSAMVTEGVRASRLLKRLAWTAGLSSVYLDDINALLDGALTATECIERLTAATEPKPVGLSVQAEPAFPRVANLHP